MIRTYHSAAAASVTHSTSTSVIASQAPKGVPPGRMLEIRALNLGLNVGIGVALVLFILRKRFTAGDSTRAKTCRFILRAAKILLMIAFFPITAYCYLFLRCWNCGKIGHYARNCPEHWRCWSCGELGHHAKFCPKHSRFIIGAR